MTRTSEPPSGERYRSERRLSNLLPMRPKRAGLPPTRVDGKGRLVSRFRSSPHCAAPSFANFGIEGHYQLIDLVWLWFRSPHFGPAARMMRTSEPPHWRVYDSSAAFS